VASLEELSSPAHAYRSVEVLYSEEAIKTQQRSERENKPVNSLASNKPILLVMYGSVCKFDLGREDERKWVSHLAEKRGSGGG
jgi:hypothetical protein